MTGISIRELNKSYNGNQVLFDLNLDIQEGEFLTLLGPSGCGKTTTLRCVAGLEQADHGSITIGDRTVFDAERHVAAPPERRDLGMVFQSYALWPHLTVYGNIAYPLKMRKVPRKEIRPRVAKALRLVDLEQMIDRPVGSMSGGQQQRVALARALVAGPQALLFDEPLSNLDAALRATMRSELQDLHERVPTTSLYVTHDQTEALTLSDRIVVMRGGRIQQVGTPVEIYTRPVNEFVARFVGFENFVPGSVVERSGDDATIEIQGSATPLVCPGPDLNIGEAVTLAARPNGVSLSLPGSMPDRLAGTIVAETYLGEQIEYDLRVEDLPMKARVSASDAVVAQIAVGDRVDVGLPLGAIHTLPGSPETATTAI